MQDANFANIIQIPVSRVNAEELIQQLSEQNFQLHQTIDEMTNTLAMQKELLQQLRDEISNLKGQKPKPKIPPGKLEGSHSKLDWQKRIGPYDNPMNTVLLALWLKNFTNCNRSNMGSLSCS